MGDGVSDVCLRYFIVDEVVWLYLFLNDFVWLLNLIIC